DLCRFPKPDAGAERADRLRRRDAAGLDIAGEANAPQLAALLRRLAALREAGIVGLLHGGVEGGAEIAGVVVHDDRRLVRELGDEVDAAELRRAHAELARGRLHRALDQVAGLGPAGAPIS